MAVEFLTIKKEGKGIYKEKMSKFLSFALPVRDATAAKEIIKRYQNEYHDARHVCWAYMLGPDRLEWQANDNGEPSGTAGKPILGQINSLGLTNVIVLVVRYFGGIKLGTSGLISAYREAAREALEDAEKELEYVKREAIVRFPYISMNAVMALFKKFNVEMNGQEFDNTCLIRFSVKEEIAENFLSRLQEIDGAILDNI